MIAVVILSLLCSAVQGFNTDTHLSDQQQAEVVAFTALLEDRLLPAIVSTLRISVITSLVA